MNARQYRTDLNISPLDFPAIMGLGETEIFFGSEPFLVQDKVVLKIAKSWILTEMDNNERHEVLKVQSVYEIPANVISSREDVYEFYKDATLGLNEVCQYAQTQMPGLPSISFPYIPIENYRGEIDRVFQLLDSRN